MKLNTTNQFEDGQILFEEGDDTGYVCFVMKGKVQLYNRGFSTVMGAGALIGASEGSEEVSSYTCVAKDGAAVYAFQSKQPQILTKVLASNKEYAPISVAGLSRLIQELLKQYKRLNAYTGTIYTAIKDSYAEYIRIAKDNSCNAGLIPEIPQLEEYVPTVVIESQRIAKANELAKIPYEGLKGYYSYSVVLAMEALKELSALKELLIDACVEMSDYIYSTAQLMILGKDYSLYRNLLGTGFDLKAKGKSTAAIEVQADKCIEVMKNTREIVKTSTHREWDVDEAELKKLGDAYASGSDFRSQEAEAAKTVEGDIAAQLDSLKDSLEQIYNFCNYPEDMRAAFQKLFDEYCAMPDKESTEDEYRKLRRGLAEEYYNLYEQVFLTSMQTSRIPKAVDLMLDFGYVSEKLLHEDQIIELLRLKNDDCSEPCVVYTMREWLKLVYMGTKDPSRNDMGLDFADVLREMKKQGKIDDKGIKEYNESGPKKVAYEIHEVLSHGNRIVNGQLSTFVPILHSEMIIGDIARSFSTRSRVNDAVDELRYIDFSIFSREALYVDPKKKIEKEYMMKEVFPIFIMYPTIGQNVIMWQEITGRRRDTEGRFFAPMIAFTAIRDMMIKAFGQYRWALCKTIQGTNWNNIQVRSLTSEYSDYIQFYKKNKDLSEERREKIKLQIQRGRNNLREIFTQDYVAWMKSEAAGAIKLNKVAREMLAMWCPFSAEIKNGLIKQPLYEEAFARNTRERNKKVHELDMRYRSFESKGIEVPPELQATLVYYRDL